MTMIKVDGPEMEATASVLQATAADLADIGGGVRGQCACCCLPSDIEGQVLTAASAVEANLSQLSGEIQFQANDLVSRGAVANNDSLPTAASAASGDGVVSAGALPSPGPGLTWSVIGGQSLYEPTLINVGMVDPTAGTVTSGGMVMTSFNEGSDGLFDNTGLQAFPPWVEKMFADAMGGVPAPPAGADMTTFNNNLWAHTLGLNATSTAMNTVPDSNPLIGSNSESGLVLGGLLGG